MTVSYKKSGSGGGLYYIQCTTNDLSHVDDYYTAGKEPPGRWFIGANTAGSRHNDLGVKHGEAFSPENFDAERFEALINGWHPENGNALTQNTGRQDRVALHDFCLSAPKSVSSIWSQATPTLKASIELAQQRSAQVFLDFMSSKSYTRRGKDGVNRISAPLRAAMFGHGSSREDDPQLHTHAVIFNFCQTTDGKSSALETKEMMRWQGAAASLYHAKLAWEMRQLGFGIETNKNLFEVAGVPKEVMNAFSQRRSQIVASVENKLAAMGLDPDAASASRGLFQVATIESRNAKNELTREQLQALWIERGKALGFTETEVRLLANCGPAVELSKQELLEAAREAVTQITDTNATFREPALLTKVAIKLIGRASPEQIVEAVDQIKKELLTTLSTNRVAGKARYDELTGEPEILYTTKEMVVVERQMLELCKRRDGAHVLPHSVLPKELSHEQREAVVAATTDSNAVTVLEGAAGAGKTFAAKPLAELYERHGYLVTGLSGSWSAANNLKREASLADGRAITGWALDVKNGRVSVGPRDLIIVDEAGLVGAKQMKTVLEIAEKGGAKVVLMGDVKQQHSVSAGDALRCITAEIGSSRLDIIRRQSRKTDRDAVKQFFDGQAKTGLQPYLDRGAVHIQNSEAETHQKMVSDWHRSRSRTVGDEVVFSRGGQDLKGSIEDVNGDAWRVRVDDQLHDVLKTHILLAVDEVSVAELNKLAHETRKRWGELGTSALFHNIDCKNKDDRVEFSVGDDVVFRKSAPSLGVFNREGGVIESIRGSLIDVRTSKGRLVEMNSSDDEWKTKSEGKEPSFALQHAYATTIYSSQGLTAGHVFVKDSIVLSRKNAGVAMSRHKEDATIYIDKRARYEAKMKETTASEWVHIAQFSDDECMQRLARSWSLDRGKDSTLDFTEWRSQGAKVNIENAVEISKIEQARELAAAELERIRQSSKHAEMRAVKPAQEFPFQLAASYGLPEPTPSRDTVHAGIDKLVRDAIDVEVIAEANKQGFLRFDANGRPNFCGRRTDGALVNLVSDTQASTEGLRGRYPPILRGDSTRVDVVPTGQDALALWSLQEKKQVAKSTVIVSRGNPDSITLPHTRNVIESAEQFVVHPGSLRTEMHAEENLNLDIEKESITDVNKSAAQEAARIAAEQAAQVSSRRL